jgi:putative endonuclease
MRRRELTRRGYVIRARNWRCTAGELDIVAEQDEQIVFVEVRARRSNRFGTPEESVTWNKRAHLIAAARAYLHAHDLVDREWRIDFVAVEFSARGQLLRLDVIENAIQAQGPA